MLTIWLTVGFIDFLAALFYQYFVWNFVWKSPIKVSDFLFCILFIITGPLGYIGTFICLYEDGFNPVVIVYNRFSKVFSVIHSVLSWPGMSIRKAIGYVARFWIKFINITLFDPNP